MARAAVTKSRTAAKPAPQRAPARRTPTTKRRTLSEVAGLPLERQIALLKKDRDALVAALDASEARAAALEARQAEVADRVAWALDALRDLAEARR